jgi:hypothetical protein
VSPQPPYSLRIAQLSGSRRARYCALNQRSNDTVQPVAHTVVYAAGLPSQVGL